jgi:hypothetical protein
LQTSTPSVPEVRPQQCSTLLRVVVLAMPMGTPALAQSSSSCATPGRSGSRPARTIAP